MLVALVTLEAREVGGGEFKQFCTLAPCGRESPAVTLLRRGSIVGRIQQIASYRFVNPLLSRLNDHRKILSSDCPPAGAHRVLESAPVGQA